MSLLPPVLQILLAAIVVFAAVWDLRYRRIPNRLALAGLLGGLGLNVFLYGATGLNMSLLGVALAAAIYMPLYWLRAMGAGDVKLMAAIGSIVGAANWFGIFLLTGILGGVVAVFLLMARKSLSRTVGNTMFLANELVHLRAPHSARGELDVHHPSAVTLPHGAVIALGCLTYLIAASVWAPRM